MSAPTSSVVQPLLVKNPPHTSSIVTDENMQSLKKAAPLFVGPCVTTSLGGVVVILGKNTANGNSHETYSQAEAIGILAACLFAGVAMGGVYLHYKDTLYSFGAKVKKVCIEGFEKKINTCCCGNPESRYEITGTLQGSSIESDENLNSLKEAAPVFIAVGITTLIGGLIILMGKKSKASEGSSYVPFSNAEAIGILAGSAVFGAALGIAYQRNKESIRRCIICIPVCSKMQITSIYNRCCVGDDDELDT